MIVIGPHRYRNKGMSQRKTRKKSPKNITNPPRAKYAIESSFRSDPIAEGTIGSTKPPVLQSGDSRIIAGHDSPSQSRWGGPEASALRAGTAFAGSRMKATPAAETP